MGPRLFRGAPCTNQGLPPSRPNTCRRESGGLLESGHADEGEGVTVGRGLGIDDVNALHARQSAEGGHVRAIGLVEDAVDHALDPVDFLEPGTGSLAEVMARETVACCALTVASWLTAADLADGLATSELVLLARNAVPKVAMVEGLVTFGLRGEAAKAPPFASIPIVVTIEKNVLFLFILPPVWDCMIEK